MNIPHLGWAFAVITTTLLSANDSFCQVVDSDENEQVNNDLRKNKKG